MKLVRLKNIFPTISNTLLALLSAILLILSFPDFEFWFLAFVALIPLFLAIEREKEFWRKSFFLGWIFGTIFFFGTCWWLTFAPINYAGFPPLLAYILLFCAASVVGLFPAIFAAIFSVFLKRFGSFGILAAPFLWTAVEFLRFNLTGNNWNAIGYSQAFDSAVLQLASFGGVSLVGFLVVLGNSFFGWLFQYIRKEFGSEILTKHARLKSDLSESGETPQRKNLKKVQVLLISGVILFFLLSSFYAFQKSHSPKPETFKAEESKAFVAAVQPNVPMSGMKYADFIRLRERHVELAEKALMKINEKRTAGSGQPIVVIFPESPMIFMYSEDPEFRQFIKQFAAQNNAYVLFNSAEPDGKGKRNFNSAVMINPEGGKIAQYDKIHLLPFGEFTPLPDFLADQLPAFVGTFSFGNEFDLMPFGEAKGGVMICFESHFASLSREYVARGADFLIEMTNDGYLGNTPVLRQHLANSVFRAVETNRPLLRVTNVGITAYITERGEVLDTADVYAEASRAWTVSKSDESRTFYVRFGEWAAWLCSVVSLALLFLSFWRKRAEA